MLLLISSTRRSLLHNNLLLLLHLLSKSEQRPDADWQQDRCMFLTRDVASILQELLVFELRLTQAPGTWYLLPPFLLVPCCRFAPDSSQQLRGPRLLVRLLAHLTVSKTGYFFPVPELSWPSKSIQHGNLIESCQARLARCPPPATDPTESCNVKSTVLHHRIPSIHIVGH